MPKKTTNSHATAIAMANFLQSHAASAGNVTREDLLAEFTAEEIDTHFEEAKRYARERAPMRQAA